MSSNGRKNIVLKYEDGENIVFDWRCKTQCRWIARIEVLLYTGEVTKLSSNGIAKHSKWKDVNKLHRELGHPGEDVTRATGKHMDLKITFTSCKDCGIGKAKQSKLTSIPQDSKYRKEAPLAFGSR